MPGTRAAIRLGLCFNVPSCIGRLPIREVGFVGKKLEMKSLHHPLPPSWAVTTSGTALGRRSFAVTAPKYDGSKDAESSSDLSRLARQASVSLGGNFAGRLLNFLTYALLARMLGPASLGLYAIGTALLQMLEGVARLGMSNGVIRLGTKYRRTAPVALKQVLAAAVTLTGGSGLLIAFALWVLAQWIASEIFGNGSLTVVIRWFAIAVPLLAMLRLVAAATRVTLRTRHSVWASEIAPGVGNLLLLGVFWLAGYALAGAIAARVLSVGVALVIALLLLLRLFPGAVSVRHYDRRTARQLLSFSVPTAAASILGGLLLSMDRLLIGAFCTSAEVGVYQIAAQTSLVLGSLLAGVNAIFVPMAADLHHLGERRRMESLFRISTRWGLHAATPLFLVMTIFAPEILNTLYGAEYRTAAASLVILSCGQFVNVASGAAGSVLVMSGYPKRWLTITTFVVAANLGLNLILIPRAGIAGAAVATSLANLLLFSAALWQVRTNVGIWPYDYRYCKSAAAAVVSTAALVLLPLSGWTGLALLASATAVSYAAFAASLAAFGLDREERRLVRWVTNVISRGRRNINDARPGLGPACP